MATVLIQQQIKSELKIWMRGGNAQYGRLQTLPNGLKEINQRRYKRENGERQRQPFWKHIYKGKTFEGHVKLVLRAFSRIFHAKNLSDKNFT